MIKVLPNPFDAFCIKGNQNLFNNRLYLLSKKVLVSIIICKQYYVLIVEYKVTFLEIKLLTMIVFTAFRARYNGRTIY